MFYEFFWYSTLDVKLGFSPWTDVDDPFSFSSNYLLQFIKIARKRELTTEIDK